MTCATCTSSSLRRPADTSPAARSRHTRNQAVLAHINAVHRASSGTWEVWMRAELTLPLPADIDDQDLAPHLPHPSMVELLEEADTNGDSTSTFSFLWTGQVDACEDTYEEAAAQVMTDDGYPADLFECDHDYSEFKGTGY